MANPTPGTDEWLAQVIEPIIEPELPIVDPHHHLWHHPGFPRYHVPELQGDTGSGHNVTRTIYMECGSEYRQDGPVHLRPVGETEFVVSQAKQSRQTGGSVIAGIIGRADLAMGDGVAEVLNHHIDAAGGLFRGIRHAGARVADRENYSRFAGRAPAGLYGQERFREGVRVLGRMGLTYDTWQYHYQIGEFGSLAAAVPDTQMILDHFSTPLGVGPYAGKQDEIFEVWKKDMAELAHCENVVLKIGGLAMPDNGFGWDTRPLPATSDEFAMAQRRYFLHAIDCFGTDRCMMESNFPVDRLSISYHVLFNGMKKIVGDFSRAEKHQLFHGTAERIYSV